MGPTCLFSTIGWSYIWRTPQVAQNCFRAPILKSRFLKLRFHVVLSLEKIIFYWNWTLKIHLLDSNVVFFEIRRKVTNHSTLVHNLLPPPPSRCHVWPGECVEFLRVWVCVCVCLWVWVCMCVCVHLCEEIHPIQCLVWSENHPLDKFGFGVKTRGNGKNTQRSVIPSTYTLEGQKGLFSPFGNLGDTNFKYVLY